MKPLLLIVALVIAAAHARTDQRQSRAIHTVEQIHAEIGRAFSRSVNDDTCEQVRETLTIITRAHTTMRWGFFFSKQAVLKIQNFFLLQIICAGKGLPCGKRTDQVTETCNSGYTWFAKAVFFF
jgi:hypothetical protein